jgi:valyl-tRNA synthetase
MSKSLGTGIDPLREIETHGADAVRFGLLAMSSTQDVRYSVAKIEQGQALANKLYNATRFVALRVGDGVEPAPRPRSVEDRWILSRLQAIKTDTQARVDGFDFSKAALGLYDFIYGELCDWYLELIKPRLRAGEPELAATLLYVLTETLALAHPMIPFVTEEIYSYLPGAEALLAAGIPEHGGTADEAAEASLAQVIEAVQALRAWRNAAGVKAGATMPARLSAGGYAETGEHLARLARLAFSENGEKPVASVPVPGGTIEILANEHLDLEASERKRAARRAQLEVEVERAEKKLANQGFVAKAPPQVVEAERAKLERLREELAAL